MERLSDDYPDIREQVRRGNFRLLYRLLLISGLICAFVSFAFIDVSPLLALMPLLAAGLMGWSRGYIGFAVPERWNRPDTIWPAILGGCFSWLVAMFAAPNFVDYQPLIPWCIGLGVLMLAPFIYVIRRHGHNPARWVWLSLICLTCATTPAATGLMISLNYRLDDQKKRISRGIVLDKGKSSGRRGNSYTIDIQALELQHPNSRFSVPKYWYESVQPGDTIALLSGSGRFGAPWFELYGLIARQDSMAQ